MQSIKCHKCGYECSLDVASEFFHKNVTKLGGYHNACKECRKIVQQEYNSRLHVKQINQHRNYSKNYGLSLAEVQQMWLKQAGKCAICCEDIGKPGTSKNTHVDHSHSTQQVRGLLCSSCNIGLGCFKDNFLYLNSAVNYLLTNSVDKGTINI